MTGRRVASLAHPACNTSLRVPIYDDIGISTGAYANFSLAAALLRIGEIAPSAEILSVGRHTPAR